MTRLFCPPGISYIIKYNNEIWSSGVGEKILSPKNEIFITRRRIIKIYEIPLNDIECSFLDLQFYTEDRFLIESMNVNFQIRFDPFKNAEDSKTREENSELHDVYSNNLERYFKKAFDIKKTKNGYLEIESIGEISTQLTDKIKIEIRKALQKLSSFDLWSNNQNKAEVCVTENFQNLPLELVPNSFYFTKPKGFEDFEKGQYYRIGQKEEYFTTVHDLIFKDVEVAFRVFVDSEGDDNKYESFFKAFDRDTQKGITSWLKEMLNTKETLSDFPYDVIIDKESCKKKLIEKLCKSIDNYPFKIDENSFYLNYNISHIPKPQDLFTIVLEEANFGIKDGAVFEKLAITFNLIFLEDSKFGGSVISPTSSSSGNNLSEIVNFLRNIKDNEISPWIIKQLKSALLEKIRSHETEDLLDADKMESIKTELRDLIKTQLQKQQLFTLVDDSLEVKVEIPQEAFNFFSDMEVTADVLPISKFIIAKRKELFENFHKNRKELANTEISPEAIKGYRKKQEEIEALRGDLHLTSQKNSILAEEEKERISGVLGRFLAQKEALEDPKKKESYKKLGEEIDFPEIEKKVHNDYEEVLKKRFKLEKLISTYNKDIESEKKKHEIELKELETEIRGIIDKYEFNAQFGWKYLLQQSVTSEQDTLKLLKSFVEYLLLLEYSNRDESSKRELLSTLTKALNTDIPPEANLIKIMSSNDFNLSSIFESIKEFSTQTPIQKSLHSIMEKSPNFSDEDKHLEPGNNNEDQESSSENNDEDQESKSENDAPVY